MDFKTAVVSMREERKIQCYQSLPDKLALMAVFALFFALVLALLLIPLFSLAHRQSQTIPLRRGTELSLVAAKRRERRPAVPNNPFCSRGAVVPDLGDHVVLDRNLRESQAVLASATNNFDQAPLRAEFCSRV